MRIPKAYSKEILFGKRDFEILEGAVMSEKDKCLIEQAKKIQFIDWSLIDVLIDKAESLETKNILNKMHISKYHEEECFDGII